MRNWLGPLAFGFILAAATAWAVIGAIPYGLMNVAMERLGQGGINTMSHGNLATPARQPVSGSTRHCTQGPATSGRACSACRARSIAPWGASPVSTST